MKKVYISILFMLVSFASLVAMDPNKRRQEKQPRDIPPAKRTKISPVEKKQDLRLIQQLVKGDNVVPKIPEDAGIIKKINQKYFDEYLDIEVEEPLLATTFKELIEQTIKNNEVFILAVVEMQDPKSKNKIIHNYYEATGLNFYLFEYSIINPGLFRFDSLEGKKDPFLRLPIEQIQYFIMSNIRQKKFQYVSNTDTIFEKNDKNELTDKAQMSQYYLNAHQNLNKNQQVEAQYNLAGLYAGKKDRHNAKNYFKKVMQNNDNPRLKAQAFYELGVLENDNKLKGQAVKILKNRLQANIDPDEEIKIKHQLAYCYLKEGDFRNAKQWLFELTQQDESQEWRAEAFYYYGLILQKQHKSNALFWLGQAAKQDDILEYKALALYQMGLIYNQKEDIDKAIKNFRHAIQVGLSEEEINIEAHKILAELLIEKNQITEAIKLLEFIITQEDDLKNKMQAHVALARLYYYQKNDVKKAEEHALIVAKQNQFPAIQKKAQALLVGIYKKLGQTKKANEFYKKAMAKD